MLKPCNEQGSKQHYLGTNQPFISIGQALINVKNGELTLRVGDDQVKFNLYRSMEFPSDENTSCMRIDTLIPSKYEMLYDFGRRGPLEQCLTKSLSTTELGNEDLSSTPKLIETLLTLKMNEENSALKEDKKSPDGLVLK